MRMAERPLVLVPTLSVLDSTAPQNRWQRILPVLMQYQGADRQPNSIPCPGGVHGTVQHFSQKTTRNLSDPWSGHLMSHLPQRKEKRLSSSQWMHQILYPEQHLLLVLKGTVILNQCQVGLTACLKRCCFKGKFLVTCVLLHNLQMQHFCLMCPSPRHNKDCV